MEELVYFVRMEILYIQLKVCVCSDQGVQETIRNSKTESFYYTKSGINQDEWKMPHFREIRPFTQKLKFIQLLKW